MSRGISGGKKKRKKLPIRIKVVKFVYSLKQNNYLMVVQNAQFEFREVLTSLLLAVRTSPAAGTKRRSQVKSAGSSTGQHATVNRQYLKCLLTLITT